MHWSLVSAFSGCAWGLIAFVLMDSRPTVAVLGAVASAPVIGVIMGRLSKGFCSGSLTRRFFITLGSLYLAVAIFGGVGGACAALYESPAAGPQPSGWIVARAVEAAFEMVVGLTGMGYVLALAPLAYANHFLVDAVASE